MKPYQKLSDCSLFPEGNAIEIWYMRTEAFRDLNIGDFKTFDPAHPEKTHILLGTISGVKNRGCREDTLEVLFHDLQGEFWSPRGEASPLIRQLGLSHTTMCVGDMVRFTTGNDPATYLCANSGWTRF